LSLNGLVIQTGKDWLNELKPIAFSTSKRKEPPEKELYCTFPGGSQTAISCEKTVANNGIR